VKAGALAGARVVAFATHAGVAGELPGLAEPALVLTPPAVADEGDDGLLTASEVARLSLDADLAVLSACNTAAADGSPGAPGLSGLAKAFLHAGSRSLLVSHWAVLSDAAARLTTGMFAELARDPGLGRAEALRRSAIALADDPGRPDLAHPRPGRPSSSSARAEPPGAGAARASTASR
jgi:CHAT domain-containing protein